MAYKCLIILRRDFLILKEANEIDIDFFNAAQIMSYVLSNIKQIINYLMNRKIC